MRWLSLSANLVHAREERMWNLHLRFARHKFVFSDTQNKAVKREDRMENWAAEKTQRKMLGAWRREGAGRICTGRENLWRRKATWGRILRDMLDGG